MENIKPKYATLQYAVLKDLDISINEYFYLDMVWYLSRTGWCNKSLENIASDMNISKIGVMKLRNRLIDRGFLEKNRKGYVKTTDMYNKVYLTNDGAYNKVTKSYNKVYSGGKQSIPKNNNRITENNKTEKREEHGTGYERAKAVRDQLARRKSLA